MTTATHPTDSRSARPARRRRSAADELLTQRDIQILRWTCEQYACRIDHVQQLLGCAERQTQRVIARLRAHQLVDYRLLAASEPRWVLPTPFGLRVSQTGFRRWKPNLALLAHVAAVNQVRLHIEHQSPETTWVCERELARRNGTKSHLADGLALLDGKRIAIEVELTPKSRARTTKVIDELCAAHDAVIYYASPQAHDHLTGLAEHHSWPTLGIRELPTTGGDAS